MKLESNLIKIEGGMYSLGGSIISRSRVEVDPGVTDVTVTILNFIQNNLSAITPYVKNEAFISQLDSKKDLSIDEISQLNYVLATYGLQLTNWCVADLEVNSNEIPNNSIEYNVIDLTGISFNFIPFATKIVMDKDTQSVTGLYTKILELYGPFEGELFADFNNPIKNDLIVVKQQETALGSVNNALTDHINTTLRFIGKDIYTIYN